MSDVESEGYCARVADADEDQLVPPSVLNFISDICIPGYTEFKQE